MALRTYGRGHPTSVWISPDSFQEEKAKGILFSRWGIIAILGQPVVKSSSHMLSLSQELALRLHK